MKQEIQGRLLNAVSKGGVEALWKIAQGSGPVTEAARNVLELVTSPLHDDISIYQAINIICGEKK